MVDEHPVNEHPVNEHQDVAPTRLETSVPGLHRLRLDVLLQELVNRAQDLIGAEHKLQRLLDAVVSVAVEQNLPDTLRRITEVAAELADAEFAALAVIGPDRRLAEFVTVGQDPEASPTIGDRPAGEGILGLIISDPEPLRLPDLKRYPSSAGFPPGHPPPGAFLGVPVRVRAEVFGNLYLTAKRGGGEFSAQDEDLMVALAAAAGIAIDNARAAADRQRLAVYEDRDRIARDLHDLIIQRLFAIGLGLQGVLAQVTEPDVAQKLSDFVDDLDATIHDVRKAIFSLQEPDDRPSGLRGEIVRSVSQAATLLRFEPLLTMSGPLDSAVPDGLRPDLLAVITEALTNVARHSGARTAEVRVAMDAATRTVTAEVDDDGVGPRPTDVPGNGSLNMAHRAKRSGGTFEVAARPAGGTRLTWSVPLDSPATAAGPS